MQAYLRYTRHPPCYDAIVITIRGTYYDPSRVRRSSVTLVQLCSTTQVLTPKPQHRLQGPLLTSGRWPINILYLFHILFCQSVVFVGFTLMET